MSRSHASFMELALNGEILASEIDDFVEQWHIEDSDELTLHDFLGMTPQEYSLWVSDPDAVPLIIAARHRRQTLVDAVNDNISGSERVAARSDKAWKISLLQNWIRRQLEQ